jgi:uncharacterized protein
LTTKLLRRWLLPGHEGKQAGHCGVVKPRACDGPHFAFVRGMQDLTANKQLIVDFFAGLNTFLAEVDPAVASPLLLRAFDVVAEDVKWWVPDDTKPERSRLPFAGTKTKTQYRDQVVGAIVKGFNATATVDRLKFTVTSVLAEGDRVAAEIESDGLHFSGKRYQNRYHFLFTIENRKIVAVKEYMDTLHLGWLITPDRT